MFVALFTAPARSLCFRTCWAELLLLSCLPIRSAAFVKGARPQSFVRRANLSSAAARPHILMILADDLGYNDVGWNGGEIKTPHMNELLASGVQFTEFHAHAVCTPSRASLLSGRYAFHTGMQHGFIPPGGGFAMPRDIPLIGDALREAGYTTHMVGKWHLGHVNYADLPLNRGFDTFYGFIGSAEDYYTHEEKDFLDMWDGCAMDNSTAGTYTADLFTTKAIDVIQAHDRIKPMFLYLAYQSVHAPMQAPPGMEDLYPEITHSGRRTLAQMVTHLDASINSIVRALERRGMWKNTLLIFASDNGGPTWVGNSNWPMRGGKFTMWQGGLKVPAFMVHGGGKLRRAPNVFTPLVHLMDLAPTFLGAAGVNQQSIERRDYDGMNLWPYITGLKKASVLERRYLVTNIDTVNTKGHIVDKEMWSGFAGIRNKTWKYVMGHPGFPSALCHAWPNSTHVDGPGCKDMGNRIPSDMTGDHLYNLEEDPSESADVAKQNPAIVAEMKKRLQPYFMSEAKPANDFLKISRKAQLMAKIAGGWSPWEACPPKAKCACDAPETLIGKFKDSAAAAGCPKKAAALARHQPQRSGPRHRARAR